MNKPSALLFYQYLPPWRIDVFNEIGRMYRLTIVFFNAECEGFTYNRNELLSKLKDIEIIFLNTGFKVGSRPVRFGISKLIQQYKPNVIFAHEYSFVSLRIALYRTMHKNCFRFYLTTSDNLAMAQSSSGFKKWSRDYVLRHADGVIVYSQKVKEYYKNQYPALWIGICPNIQNPASLVAYRKDFANYHATFKRQFCISDSDKILLYIGRLVYAKGLDLLLQSFARVALEGWKLVIVGSGKEETALKELTNSLRLTDKVVFAGFFTDTALYAWYDIADCFILPSRYEPFGAVVNEALVYGCPVLASKYIGATDFITNENGLLFDPLDPKEIDATLKQVLNGNLYRKGKRDLMPVSFKMYISVFKH